MPPVVSADVSSKVLLVSCLLILMIIGGFVFCPCYWVWYLLPFIINYVMTTRYVTLWREQVTS